MVINRGKKSTALCCKNAVKPLENINKIHQRFQGINLVQKEVPSSCKPQDQAYE